MIESEDGWSCTRCGAPAEMKFGAWSFGEQVEAARCQKHLRSNPCAALGCKHTRIAKGRLNETSFLCRDHWREVCPPHSRIRKSWRRFFRLATKMGLKIGRASCRERVCAVRVDLGGRRSLHKKKK